MEPQYMRVLEEIRDAVRDNSTRLDQTNERLDRTNARLDRTNESLERVYHGLERVERVENRIGGLDDRVTSVDLRVGIPVMQVATTLGDPTRLLSDRFELRDRVERCELAIQELQRRP